MKAYTAFGRLALMVMVAPVLMIVWFALLPF